MTIDDLAVMVQGGFNEVNKHLQGHEKRFDHVDHELKLIRKQLMDVVERGEFEKLEERVRDLENMLSALIKKAA